HDDGDRGGRMLRRFGGRRRRGHDDVDLETDEFGRKFRGPVEVPLGPSGLNGDVLSLNVAQRAKRLPEWFEAQGGQGSGAGKEKAYSKDLRRQLGVGGTRGCQ